MQARRDLVAAAAKFAARVQHSIDDRHGGQARLVLNADRNAAAVVGDVDDVAGLYDDVDAVAEPRERLIDGVVDNLIHEVMQPAHTGRADIHARALADRFEPFEHLDLVFIIGFACLCHFFDIQNFGSSQTLTPNKT